MSPTRRSCVDYVPVVPEPTSGPAATQRARRNCASAGPATSGEDAAEHGAAVARSTSAQAAAAAVR